MQAHGREIALEAGPEMVGKVKFRNASDTECGAFRVVIVRVVASAELSAMYHHSTGKSLYRFLLLRCRFVCRAADAYGQHQRCNHSSYVHGANI